MKLHEILKRPLITEKSTRLQEEDRYVFEVAKRATKTQVKEAVALAFKVKVIEVNMVTVPGHKRRLGRREVMTPGLKKAIVTLEKGNKIQFFGGV